MQKRQFPRGQGLAFAAKVTQDGDDVVIIAPFVFTLNGQQHDIAGNAFAVSEGDIIYITPIGLQRMTYQEETKSSPYPLDTFDTGAAYWLVQKTNNDIIVLEVA